ncbi:18156_t:CDS:2, partial [Gigaspora margarita]
TAGETDAGNENLKMNTGVDNRDDFDVEAFVDLEAQNQQVNPELRTDHARGVVLIRDHWRQKIGPAPVVMDWLMNGVLLYPRGTLVIAT